MEMDPEIHKVSCGGSNREIHKVYCGGSSIWRWIQRYIRLVVEVAV